jgi:cysteine dioxygenase
MTALNNILEGIDRRLQDLGIQEDDFCTFREVLSEDFLRNLPYADAIPAADDKPYSRNILYLSDTLEVVLVNWRTAMPCMIHGHGQSFGMVYVYSGSILDTAYMEEFRLRRESIYHPGNYIEVPTNAFHQLENIAPGEAVTIHFYTPPIKGMVLIDLENRRRIQVSEECGAWEPEASEVLAITAL